MSLPEFRCEYGVVLSVMITEGDPMSTVCEMLCSTAHHSLAVYTPLPAISNCFSLSQQIKNEHKVCGSQQIKIQLKTGTQLHFTYTEGNKLGLVYFWYHSMCQTQSRYSVTASTNPLLPSTNHNGSQLQIISAKICK